MTARRCVTTCVVCALAGLALGLSLVAGCSPASSPEQVSEPLISADEHDPAVWGEVHPEVYSRWLATKEERPAGKSAFKRGYDGGVMFDKLSEYPFMAVLFNGWGFGIDYKEPRGHYYMLIDQAEADPSRVKSGGACLTCKSPSAEDLHEESAEKLFTATYPDAVAMLPSDQRQLGAACIDCHDAETLTLRTRRWTVDAALDEIGLPKSEMTNVQQRTMVCGQCHCTYSLLKDGGTVVDVDFPWEGGEWGAITVEDIIANLESQPKRIEWQQSVTGFKLGFIRHPDIEFFTAGSPHAKAGASCDDCHMPRIRVGGVTIPDHNLMSPLKHEDLPCKQCHPKSDEELRAQVIAIQERSLANLINAGYEVASVAKLFEIANASLETTAGDPAYDAAAKHYREAFYRVVYMGAENSVGFHNPDEGERILTDARDEAAQARSALLALLDAHGVRVPREVPLTLRSYLDNRGVHGLDFEPDQLIPDPSGHAERTWPRSLRALMQ